MEAWRSTCPRHSVWEDAFADGLLEVADNGATLQQSDVALTARGRALLSAAKCDPQLREIQD